MMETDDKPVLPLRILYRGGQVTELLNEDMICFYGEFCHYYDSNDAELNTLLGIERIEDSRGREVELVVEDFEIIRMELSRGV